MAVDAKSFNDVPVIWCLLLTLYGYKIRNRTANLRRPVGRTIIFNTVKSYQRGRRYSKLVVGNSPGRPSPVFLTI